VAYEGKRTPFRIVIEGPGGTRTLPKTDPEVELVYTGLPEVQDQALGGTTDISFALPGSEVIAHPTVYAQGQRVLVFDDDDGGRCIGGGEISTPPQPGTNGMTVHADGDGQKPMRMQDRPMVWLTYETEGVQPAGERPYRYPVNDQIFARLDGRDIEAGWRRKEMFKRNDLGNPGEWRNGMIDRLYGEDINQVVFELKKKRNTSNAVWRLHRRATDGTLTLITTIDLSSSGPADGTTITVNVGGNPDALYWQLVRLDEGVHTRAFWSRIENRRILCRADREDYPASAVVRDIGTILGDDLSGVVDSERIAMPLDARGTSMGDVLTSMSALTNRPWTRRRSTDGTTVEMRFRPWLDRIWDLTSDYYTLVKVPLPRFNVVAIPVRREGGESDWVRERCDPTLDFAPNDAIVKRIPLSEPLPDEAWGRAMARNFADELAPERYEYRLTFDRVEDPDNPGVAVAPTRVNGGHVVRIPAEDNLHVRVGSVIKRDDGTCEATTKTVTDGETGHPWIDRIIKSRTLALARGRGNAWASLVFFDLERPKVLGNPTVAFRETDVRDGLWDGDLIFDYVLPTEDIDGNGTAIRAVIGEMIYVDGDGVPIPGLEPDKKRIDRKNLDDPEADLPTRMVWRRLRRPHQWRPQVRGWAEDYFGERSRTTAYGPVPPVLPPRAGPPTPTVAVDVDANRVTARFAGIDDADRTETAKGRPMLDRKVRWVFAELYKNGVLVTGSRRRFQDDEISWRRLDTGNHTWRVDAWTVDRYETASAVGTNSSTRARPTAPLFAPSLDFKRGGRRGLRAKGTVPTGYASGDSRDIGAYVLQLQSEPKNPVDSDEKQRLVIDLEPGDTASAQSGLWEEFIKPGHKCRARFAVRDNDSGKLSTFGPWSNPPVTAILNKKPGPVTNKRREGGPRWVEWSWNHPVAWDDGTTDGWSASEVPAFKGNVRQFGVLNSDKSFTYKDSTTHRIKVPAGSGGWTCDVEPLGWDELSGTNDGDVTAVAEAGLQVGSADITDGAINALRMFSSVGPIEIVGALPVTGNIDGRTAFLTSDRKIYRYFAAATLIGGVSYGPGWVRASDGGDLVAATITADKLNVGTLSAITANLGTVTAGFISGIDIVAATFRSAPAGGLHIQLTSGAIRFHYSNGFFAQQIAFNGSRIVHEVDIGGVTGPEIQAALLTTVAPQWSSGLSGTTSLGSLPNAASGAAPIGWVRVMRGDGTTGRVPMYT